MKSQSLLAALTLVNAVLLIFLLLQPHRTSAQEVAPVIRARALEIVDDHGRVRAAIRSFRRTQRLKCRLKTDRASVWEAIQTRPIFKSLQEAQILP